MKEMKDAIAAQQQQIQQLQQQIQSRDAAIQTLEQQVSQAEAAASQAQSTAKSAIGAEKKEDALSTAEFNALQHDVTDLKAVSANTVEGLQDTQKRVGDLESPLAIHYKGITLTPGGFLAGETFWRSHATLGEATPLNAIPFSAAGQARASEFYGSGRQSRLSMLAQGKWGTTNLTGYVEPTSSVWASPPMPTRATATYFVSDNSGPRRASRMGGRSQVARCGVW